jgi:predicted exporter
MLSLLRGLATISPFILLMTLMVWAGMTYGGILWVLFGSAALCMALLAGVCFNYAKFKQDLRDERAAKA